MTPRLTELAATLRTRPRDTRTIVAIAGAPGSGKSTLATVLATSLNDSLPGTAAILPMDGYHYDDSVLAAMGRLPRKGAPDTFDCRGLAWTLRRLRECWREDIAVPVFDREIEIARAGARIITGTTPIILVEGNYLLCTKDPWSTLWSYFDLTIMLEVPDTILRQRLRERWIRHGLDATGICHKLEDNDIPNGHHVKTASRNADIVLALDDIRAEHAVS